MTKLIEEIKYVRGLLVRAVEEKGADYVYPRIEAEDDFGEYGEPCDYVRDGAPSCIAGHVFAYHGVGMASLGIFEGDSAALVVEAHPGVGWSGVIGDALRKAQLTQDEGGTWGEALQSFDNYLAEREIPVS